MCKVECVSDGSWCLSEGVFKQSVKGVVLFLLAAYSKTYKEGDKL